MHATNDGTTPPSTGDWFAIPLRFELFAVGRTVATDSHGAMLAYFFGNFFERLPTFADVLALRPGDAQLIGVCDCDGVRGGAWPLVRGPRGLDPRPWPIPYFRAIDARTGRMTWSSRDPADLQIAIVTGSEPADVGSRNWALPMHALRGEPLGSADVEFALFAFFRGAQSSRHRRYIADLQREIASAS